MNIHDIARRILKDYGLHSLYKSHRVINGFVMLELQGNVNMDTLLESRYLRESADELGLLEVLYGGDMMNVTTSERYLIVVSGEDQYACELARLHINRAAEHITRVISSDEIQEASSETVMGIVERLLKEDADAPDLLDEPFDAQAPRTQRLARARAGRGETVLGETVQHTAQKRDVSNHSQTALKIEEFDEPF